MLLSWAKQTIRRSHSFTRVFGIFVNKSTHTRHTAPCVLGDRYPTTFKPRILEAGSPFHLPAPRGYCRLRNRCHIFGDSMVIPLSLDGCVVSTPRHICGVRSSARAQEVRSPRGSSARWNLPHSLSPQLIWSISTSSEAGTESISSVSPDLFLRHGGEWNGDDIFEYLLRIEDRTAPVTSARFLSYIAPYRFCGDSDATIRFRPSRLQNLNEPINVLEKHHALNAATITDCIPCVGAVMDFPLHPEDLILADKRCVAFSPWSRRD